MGTGDIVRDLTLVVISSAIVTLIFYRLRLPVIMGYLLAGMFLGPYFPDLPNLNDRAAIEQLSQLGVVFLMFAIGLDFDLNRLKSVFWPALIAVSLQTSLVFFLGILGGSLVGYTPIEGIFLGALLTNSASIVCIRVMRDKGRLKHADAHMAVGILIFEDIVAITLLVILSGVALSNHFDWQSIYKIVFLIGVFVVCVYYVGRLTAPWLSKFLKQTGSTELITIATVAVILGVGELASMSSFSVALGAFLAGAIMAKSRLVKEIEHVTEPFRHLFTAVFFVTIGMLIDPSWIMENWLAIVFIAGLVVLIKLLSCWLGLFVGGQNSETSFRAALSKASVGEFGFIIAALGQSLHVTGPGLTSMTVGLAIVTYLFIPILNANPSKFYLYIVNHTPKRLRLAASIYEELLGSVNRVIGRSLFFSMARGPLIQSCFYFIIMNGIIIGAYIGSSYFRAAAPYTNIKIWIMLGFWIAAALFCLPFLSGIIRNLDKVVNAIIEMAVKSGRSKPFLSEKMQLLFHRFILCVVIVIFGGIYLSAAARYFPSGIAFVVFLVLLCVAMVLFWNTIIRLNSHLEYLFLQSFQQQRRTDDKRQQETVLREASGKYTCSANVESIPIPVESVICGRLLGDINLEEETGVRIIAISRGGLTVYEPSPVIPIFPDDNIVIFGSKEQVETASKMLSAKGPPVSLTDKPPSLRLENYYVAVASPLIGDTLAGANIRHRFGVSVLGINRSGQHIAHPQATELIYSGDVLHIVGDPGAIKAFKHAFIPEISSV